MGVSFKYHVEKYLKRVKRFRKSLLSERLKNITEKSIRKKPIIKVQSECHCNGKFYFTF